VAVLTRIAASCLALGLAACATGDAQWRREAAQTEVYWVGAGDHQCSPPAPYTSLKACLLHDAAYELARRARSCMPWLDEGTRRAFTSEQARAVADAELMAKMLHDGQPELLAGLYYRFVRLGGWYSWHFGREDCEAAR
jgi:hypothetical protein